MAKTHNKPFVPGHTRKVKTKNGGTKVVKVKGHNPKGPRKNW
jgi:hypothetical protein